MPSPAPTDAAPVADVLFADEPADPASRAWLTAASTWPLGSTAPGDSPNDVLKLGGAICVNGLPEEPGAIGIDASMGPLGEGSTGAGAGGMTTMGG